MNRAAGIPNIGTRQRPRHRLPLTMSAGRTCRECLPPHVANAADWETLEEVRAFTDASEFSGVSAEVLASAYAIRDGSMGSICDVTVAARRMEIIAELETWNAPMAEHLNTNTSAEMTMREIYAALPHEVLAVLGW